MPQLKKFFIPVFLLLCIHSLTAQTAWTLQQCIDYTLQHNIQIRQSELNKDLSALQVDQNIAGMFPSLNGSVSQNYYYGRSIDPYTNTYTNQQVRSNSFSLSSNLPVFEGFQLQNSLKESRLSYMSSQFDLKKIQNDISLNVVTFYLQVLFNQENLSNATELVKASRVQRDKINRMYELGAVSKGNQLELEAQLSSDELLLVQAQANLDQSMLQLTQLMELDSLKDFSIVRPEVLVTPFNAEQTNTDAIYAAALKNQPDIVSQEYKVASAEKGLSVARGARYPRLYVGANLSTNYSTSSKRISSYDYGAPTSTFSGYTSTGDSVFSLIPNVTAHLENTPFKNQIDNNLGKSVGFSLQIPLFNGLSTHINIQRAKINVKQARLSQELVHKNLYKSVQQAVADSYSAFKKYEAGQKSVSSLEESFNYNQQKYDLGLISSYDYLQSKNNLAKAKAELLQSKFDFIFRMKILDFYQGKALTF